jgi:hypothetical protein
VLVDGAPESTRKLLQAAEAPGPSAEPVYGTTDVLVDGAPEV